MKKPIVWTIAGSDSSGGAGMQADLHAFQDMGVYGCTVVTALTAQNSYLVNATAVTTPTMLKHQIETLNQDLPAKSIKLGMLGNRESIEVIADFLDSFEGDVICDPVMASTSGAVLLSPDVRDTLITRIFPNADVVTPNLHEAEILYQDSIKTAEDIEQAAEKILTMGPKSVLIKGGHNINDFSQDYWTNGDRSQASSRFIVNNRLIKGFPMPTISFIASAA